MERTLSYASTPTTKPVVYKTVVDMVTQWGEAYPNKDAFVEYTKDGERKSVTCSELLKQARKFGKYLISSGMRRGDAAVIGMKNSLNMVTAMCGVSFAGGIVASVSANLQDGSDVINFLKNTDSRFFIADTKQSGGSLDIINIVLDSAKDLSLQRIICNGNDDEANDRTGNLLTSFQNALENDLDDGISFPFVLPEDRAFYLSTSGTSGKPKLVVYPHYALIDNSRILGEQLGIDANSVYFCDRPFGWGVGAPRMFFAQAATRVFLDTSLTVGKNISDVVSDILAAEACTHAYLPGYLAVDLLSRPDLKHKFRSVDSIMCSGERIPQTHGRLIGRFCRKLSVWYGSTEMSGVSLYVSSDPSTLEDGIIGLPSPGAEMKLVDTEGRVVNKGETGELYARNIHRLSAYVGMPEEFHKAIDASNWFHSGDIGFMREDGNFVLCGRTSEQISIATVKIFPFEIEKELMTCDGVSAAVAVPVPDARLTNVVCACVTFGKPSAGSLDRVKEFCEKTWVESSAASGISLRPKYYLEFENILTNANGKVDRRKMAEEARRLLGL